MFIFFEYTAIAVLTLLILALLFAVSAAFLMVAEECAAALRMLTETADKMSMFNDGSGPQSRVALANNPVHPQRTVLLRKKEIRQGGDLGILYQ